MSISHKKRMAVFERDDYTCRYCTLRPARLAFLEVDHIVPVAQGGTDDMSNLATACRPCNRRKYDRYWVPLDWVA